MKHILVFYIPEDHHLVYNRGLDENGMNIEKDCAHLRTCIKIYRAQKLTILMNNIHLLVYKLDHLVLIFLEGERWSGLID